MTNRTPLRLDHGRVVKWDTNTNTYLDQSALPAPTNTMWSYANGLDYGQAVSQAVTINVPSVNQDIVDSFYFKVMSAECTQ